MADEQERTEEPTAKRLEDARKEGNVPKSQEVVNFLVLLVSFVVVYMLLGYVFKRIEQLYVHFMMFFNQELTMSLSISLMLLLIQESTLILLPIIAAIIFIAIASNVIQFGFLFTTKPLEFNLDRLNPIKGIKNIFSMQKLIKGLLDTLRVLLVFSLAFFIYLGFLKELNTVALLDVGRQLKWLESKALILISALMLIFFLIAAIDLAYTRFKYKKSLRMTKQEIKDELKQMEGDPQIKRKIRQIMFQKAFSRMMSNVPKADVVVTNPTHYAVALMYDETKHKAPIVVAKGINLVAERIKKIALEHGIQIVENPPLARELYRLCDVDKEVPVELWQAVAEVLAFVRRVAKRR